MNYYCSLSKFFTNCNLSKLSTHLTEHHSRQFQIQHITVDDYTLGAELIRRCHHKGGRLYVYTKIFSIFGT
jgi:hypothetical protein